MIVNDFKTVHKFMIFFSSTPQFFMLHILKKKFLSSVTFMTNTCIICLHAVFHVVLGKRYTGLETTNMVYPFIFISDSCLKEHNTCKYFNPMINYAFTQPGDIHLLVLRMARSFQKWLEMCQIYILPHLVDNVLLLTNSHYVSTEPDCSNSFKNYFFPDIYTILF